MEDIRCNRARATDLPAVRALLRRCDLPVDDLRAGHLEHFLVCRHGGEVVGTIGLEVFDQVALLRSLAVAPEHRGSRLGHELWMRVREEAVRKRAHRLYLLTTTAERLFARWGFRPIARELVPAAIQTTLEYSSLCPDTAKVMCVDVGDERPITAS